VAQTEFVGTTYTVVHGTYTLEAILDVKITVKGGPDAEQKDVTASGDSVYTYLADPLGPKGSATSTLVVTCQASTASYGDSKNSKIPLNTAASTVVAWQPATANANEWTHATLQLTKRVHKIPFKGTNLATVELTFEANGAGTWDSPA
jgi:hypothetical protein